MTVMRTGTRLDKALYRKQHESGWVLVFSVGLALILVLFASLAQAQLKPAKRKTIIKTYTYENLVDAIYMAEGGKGYDYGISINYRNEDEARRICLRTIRNNVKRYREYGHKTHTNYLSFLGSRYCPTSGKNLSIAERKLNPNWLKNVKYFLDKQEPIRSNYDT